MKLAVILYHQNAEKIYPKSWIEEAVKSIEGQTYQAFEILELNYGGTNERYTKGRFFRFKMSNHIEAMNYLISFAFENEFDAVANVNLDDINHSQRFEKQVAKIQEGFDLVSSNFHYFGDVEKPMDMARFTDIGAQLKRKHNVVCHPAVMLSKNFWEPDLHYKNLLGFEDLDLWQRAWAKGKKFCILPEYLLFYRRHTNQIVQKYGINGKK